MDLDHKMTCKYLNPFRVFFFGWKIPSSFACMNPGERTAKTQSLQLAGTSILV